MNTNPTTVEKNPAAGVIWLSPAKAARALECSRATIWRYMQAGTLQSMRVGPRIRRVAIPRELVEGGRGAA